MMNKMSIPGVGSVSNLLLRDVIDTLIPFFPQLFDDQIQPINAKILLPESFSQMSLGRTCLQL